MFAQVQPALGLVDQNGLVTRNMWCVGSMPPNRLQSGKVLGKLNFRFRRGKQRVADGQPSGARRHDAAAAAAQGGLVRALV